MLPLTKEELYTKITPKFNKLLQLWETTVKEMQHIVYMM